MVNSFEKLAGAAPANYQSTDGPTGVAVNHLRENEIRVSKPKTFTIIKILVINR